jgi:hypothetical protein
MKYENNLALCVMRLIIDGKEYPVEVHKATQNVAGSVKILIPTFLMSDAAVHIAMACIESVKTFTQCEHEIWVIDNNSPEEYFSKLLKIGGINVVRNMREPVNPRAPLFRKKGLLGWLGQTQIPSQGVDGSYANAIALEIGMQLINPGTGLVFTMHSDTLVTKLGWLEHLCAKMDDSVRAVGCLCDNIRIHALHVSGLLYDFQLFRKLQVSMLPNIKNRLSQELPEYDVGDAVSYVFKKNGYAVYCCPNTHNSPELLDWMESGSLFDKPIVRSFDDRREVIFLHLGRGTPKSRNQYKKEGQFLADDWIAFTEHFLASVH